jgi:hypothetical protein
VAARGISFIRAFDGLGLLVIDGYADLDPAGRPGLGGYAHRVFAAPVTGVAKPAFGTATHPVPVLRGTSARPLYVTTARMPQADAAQWVRRGRAGSGYPARCAAPASSPAPDRRHLCRETTAPVDKHGTRHRAEAQRQDMAASATTKQTGAVTDLLGRLLPLWSNLSIPGTMPRQPSARCTPTR